MRKVIIVIGTVVILALILVWNVYQAARDGTGTSLNFTEFMKKVKDKQVDSVNLYSYRIEGKLKDGTQFKTILPPGAGYSLARELDDHGVTVSVKGPEEGNLIYTFTAGWLPIIIVLVFWTFLMRRMRQG